MARPIRIEYPGACYHITARGNERKAIYRDDVDRQLFLETLEEMLDQFGVMLHCYCLMPNHYHLVVQTPRANLSRALGWLQTTYSIRYNRRHKRSGHLFQGRYKAHLVEADSYARQLISYIHLNPVRPRDKTALLDPERKKELYRYLWSSHRTYAGLGPVPAWVCTEWLSYWASQRRAAIREYRKDIQRMFGKPLPSIWAQLRGGIVLGSDKLFEKAKGWIGRKTGAEEIRWKRRAEEQEVQQQIDALVEAETNPRIQIWIKVRLGGRRLVDVGKEHGYCNGSGVLVRVKRLEIRAQQDRRLAKKLLELKAKVKSVES